MAGKPAHPPQQSGPPGEHPEHPERGESPGEQHERGPQVSEQEGPLTVERLRKDDGRALIVFTRAQHEHEQQP